MRCDDILLCACWRSRSGSGSVLRLVFENAEKQRFVRLHLAHHVYPEVKLHLGRLIAGVYCCTLNSAGYVRPREGDVPRTSEEAIKFN